MRVGSLCTGIGGLDLAVQAHFGGETVWCAEWEEHLDPLIQRHLGPVLNLRDLTTVSWDELEPVDVLTAGYPCQPFSHAGKRKGTDDARHLWPYIFEGVRALRPRYVVLENVRGHLSMGFDAVLGDLAAAGFDAEWCLLRASDVGACHQRARIFVVATDTYDGRTGTARTGTVERAVVAGSCEGPSPDAGSERHGGGQDTGAVGRVDRGHAGEARERERARPVVGYRGDAATADTDRGAGQEPYVGTVEPGLGASRRGDPQRLGAATADTGVGRGEGSGLCPDEPGWQRRRRPHDGNGEVAWGRYEPAVRRWEHVLGRPAPAPTDDGKLSPAFVEWMMGYPAGWVDGLTRTQALKALGNAVVPQQALAALEVLT